MPGGSPMTGKSKPPILRVGVIGTGKHGSRYANHLAHDIPGMRLAAICRRSAEGIGQAKQWECSFHADWLELIASSDVDCVVAAVPPTMNLPIAKECARVNKPVLIEKPLAGSLEDARLIVALERKLGLQLTTGQTLRYNAVVQTLKQNIGQVGTLHTFSANQRLEPSTLKWHEDPDLAGAGVSFHTAVHVFDALRYITGLEVRRVAAVTRSKGEKQLEDVLAVLLEMDNGVVGTVDCSKVGQARSGLFEFVGDKCQLQGEQIYNKCTKIEQQVITDLSPVEPVSTIVPLLCEWEQYLHLQAPNPVSGSEGLVSVHICEACLEAARQKRWVTL